MILVSKEVHISYKAIHAIKLAKVVCFGINKFKILFHSPIKAPSMTWIQTGPNILFVTVKQYIIKRHGSFLFWSFEINVSYISFDEWVNFIKRICFNAWIVICWLDKRIPSVLKDEVSSSTYEFSPISIIIKINFWSSFFDEYFNLFIWMVVKHCQFRLK